MYSFTGNTKQRKKTPQDAAREQLVHGLLGGAPAPAVAAPAVQAPTQPVNPVQPPRVATPAVKASTQPVNPVMPQAAPTPPKADPRLAAAHQLQTQLLQGKRGDGHDRHATVQAVGGDRAKVDGNVLTGKSGDPNVVVDQHQDHPEINGNIISGQGGNTPEIDGNVITGSSGDPNVATDPEVRDVVDSGLGDYQHTGFMDSQVEKSLRDLLKSGKRNTAEEEAAAKDVNARDLGQTLADNRSRSAFGGFGLSGAASAQNQNARGAAAQQLTNNLLGIKQGARDEQFRNVGLASNAFNEESNRSFTGSESGKDRDFQGGQNDKDRAIEKEHYDAVLAYLKSQGIDIPSEYDGGSTPPAPPADGGSNTGPDQSPAAEGSQDNPIHSQPPEGATRVSLSDNGSSVWVKDGKYYVMERK